MNKKKLNNNKGFTLVELIVVLVILAILAAILVPALLGYIDRAKGQQIVLNARSAYTAAQAEMTSLYAKDKAPSMVAKTATDKAYNERLLETADVPDCDALSIGCKAVYNASAVTHDMYTIEYVKYTEGSETVYLYDGEWFTKSADGEKTAKVPGAVIDVK